MLSQRRTKSNRLLVLYINNVKKKFKSFSSKLLDYVNALLKIINYFTFFFFFLWNIHLRIKLSIICSIIIIKIVSSFFVIHVRFVVIFSEAISSQ